MNKIDEKIIRKLRALRQRTALKRRRLRTGDEFCRQIARTLEASMVEIDQAIADIRSGNLQLER